MSPQLPIACQVLAVAELYRWATMRMSPRSMRTSISGICTLALLVLLGCGDPAAKYVVGGVYSTQLSRANSPIGQLYGASKVVALRREGPVLLLSAGFYPRRPTSAAEFRADDEPMYMHPSYRSFQRQKPIFIGTIPITDADRKELSRP